MTRLSPPSKGVTRIRLKVYSSPAATKLVQSKFEQDRFSEILLVEANELK